MKNSVRSFVTRCHYVSLNYPRLWAHSGKAARRSMVLYFTPGYQVQLFDEYGMPKTHLHICS